MIIRRIRVPKLKHYKRYRPYVRRSFICKCAFCTTHEVDLGGPKFFRIDHYVPRSIDSSLTHVYKNLLYACDICDLFKSNGWHPNPLASGKGYLDPCKHDYEDHFKIKEYGILEGRTPVARYMIEHLYLNRGFLKNLRINRSRDTSALEEYDALMMRTRNILGITYEVNLRAEIRRILSNLQAGKSLVETRVKEYNQCRSETYWVKVEQIRRGGTLPQAIRQARREA